MPGIESVLNIAKEALLAHQLSVQVASHNIANVDTPGYSRQTLSLTTNSPTPIRAGMLGTGVRGELISRQYDKFMTQRLMRQYSTMGNLEAQKESLRVVETIFNEAPGMALNDLLSQFWQSWQDLANNPETMATRQTVMQRAELLVDHFQNVNAEIARTKYDIGLNLTTAIDKVNAVTGQIADLNVQITAAESEKKQANDLRDIRDSLVKDLSDYLDVTYFETSTGAYTILLSDGHPLVDTNSSWDVEWLDNKLYWQSVNQDGTTLRTAIGSGEDLGGKIGGWLEVHNQLVEGDPDNYLGRLDALANAMIRELNRQHSQGVGLTTYSQAVKIGRASCRERV